MSSASADPDDLRARRDILGFRHRMMAEIRRFFDSRGYIEVDCPIRIPTPALELHIDAIPAGDQWLRTSPEFHLNRLLSARYSKIYHLGPCFRANERGSQHSEEFTMLEWYRSEAGYIDILADTKALIGALAAELLGCAHLSWKGGRVDLLPLWELLTVSDVFLEYAGWDPVAQWDADRFDVDLIEKVEPSLPKDRPVVLKDYPAEAAALARLCEGDPSRAERWELYIGGLELANAYSELINPVEQRARFEACARERDALGKTRYEIDEVFMSALESGLPECGGIALGVDRLLMLFLGEDDISRVRPFH